MVTFRLLKPPPCGVVMGALKKTLVRRSDSQALGSMPAVIAAQVDLLADLDRFNLDARAGGFHDVERGGHDFGADAVAVRDGDGNKVRCHSGVFCLEVEVDLLQKTNDIAWAQQKP